MSKQNRLTFNALELCLLLGLSCITLSAVAQNAGLYLFMIQTETIQTIEKLRDSQNWSLKMYVENPTVLNDVLKRNGTKVISSTTEYTELVVKEESNSHFDSFAALTDATFVIDYDEPAVLTLAEQLRTELQRTPTVAELTQFVDSTINDKTYSRGFEIASQVAKHNSGDCTEHAVLLAALARYFQMPARVTFGLLLYEEDNKLMTAGHAWTNILYEGQWVRADATRPSNVKSGAIRYIPLMPLSNESPGFSADLYALTTTFPTKVADIQPYIE